MKQYVLGFLFDPNRKDVALIEKIKPEFMNGKLNGIGGLIEAGETPEVAMRREFLEETGVDFNEWKGALAFSGDGYMVSVFIGFSKQVWDVVTTESEKVGVYSWPIVLAGGYPKYVENLEWIIPMALSGKLYSVKEF